MHIERTRQKYDVRWNHFVHTYLKKKKIKEGREWLQDAG